MKNKNLSWAAALFVFALLLWCTAVTPGKVADPATYTCAVYSTFFSLLPPVIAIVLALNTKEVYTSLLVGIASGALLYANGNSSEFVGSTLQSECPAHPYLRSALSVAIILSGYGSPPSCLLKRSTSSK